MGLNLKKLFKTTIHPSKSKAAAQNKANEAKQTVSNQGVQAFLDAALRQKEALEAIYVAYATERERINTCFDSERNQLERDRIQNESDYEHALAELDEALCQANRDIEQGFEEQSQVLLNNEAEDLKQVTDCRLKVVYQLSEASKDYEHRTKNIDRLWEEAQQALLHERCQAAYRALKSPENPRQKTQSYSILVAYFRYLSQENQLSSADFERYLSFFNSLYQSKDLSQDASFSEIDQAINGLLEGCALKDKTGVQEAYDVAQAQAKKSHQADKALHKDNDIKVEELSCKIM